MQDFIIFYIAQAGNTIDGEGFIRTLAEKAPTYREDFMTIAEQLEAKGREKGRHEGYQLGRRDANKKLAKQLLADGVDRKNINRYIGLSDNELDKL